ncbi:MAG: type II/IV secretion system protein [Elusimicrobia bacterium]|nr:type II/IV secretion system protein [Elusimicrobiota bacterium]
MRINGSLQELCSLPASLTARLVARVKIISELVIHERRLPQDGQFRATIEGRKVEFRVSSLPGIYGEKIVLRVLGGTKIMGSLREMPLNERDLHLMERALRTPNGLVLVTGPTGSGKTTTLYTMIAAVNNPDVNVMTAEDPVEYRLPGIHQVHVNPHIGLKFDTVLRAFLRQDPDIMLIGEIRDLETAEIAVKASITGHLVFSTLHTNSAAASVARLIHMGLAPFLLAASVKLIIAQRLVKVLCPDCRAPSGIAPDERHMLQPEELEQLGTVYRAVGCRSCGQTGTKGRRPIFEVMSIASPKVRDLILAGGGADALATCAVEEGMTTLRQAALGAVARGEVSLPEALKVILGG